ncbi:MAG TPA: hypothetical protein VE684_12610, partial [Crenalkalicoccus sp.]|nr:hypothetical protein [Crenalkalicoccus sp.]
GYAVLSGATGLAEPWAAEQALLSALRDAGPAQGPVRHTADLIGHAVEATFPATLGMAALALAEGAVPQALVTGLGLWRGEALALVEPIEGGA